VGQIQEGGSTAVAALDQPFQASEPVDLAQAANAQAFDDAQVSAAGLQAEAAAAPAGGRDDTTRVVAPYTDYVVTQGPHGASYGHMAIDITRGRRNHPYAACGRVTITTSKMGQYTLILENENYQITLMHGNYTRVLATGAIARRWAQRATMATPWIGRDLCYGRDCGYHPISISSIALGSNVNHWR
jgi:hypothetical protein